MIFVRPGLFVSIVQLDEERAPLPLPLSSGFSDATAYQVLGVYSPSETGEAYFILANDADQIWFISNRHCCAYRILPDCTEFRLPLKR